MAFKRYSLIGAVILMCLPLFLTGCATIQGLPLFEKKIPQGTRVEDLDLGGLSYQEGEEKLEVWRKEQLSRSILLEYDQKEIAVSFEELGADLNTAALLAEIKKGAGGGTAAIVHLDKTTVSQVLREKLAPLEQLPVDAVYRIENNSCVVTAAVWGKIPDIGYLVDQIDEKAVSRIPEKIEGIFQETPPTVTTEALNALAFDSVIGEYRTYFNAAEENRSSNLAEAARAMDRKLLQPGELFSFNGTVGPRTPETGYKDAYIIINNEFVLGTGGGICQASSTLYNAVLLADLKIEERSPHAVAVAYVPVGQDATVSYSFIDFKFRNDTKGLVYIRTYVQGGSLLVQIYGKENGKTVQVESVIESVIAFDTEEREDPDLLPGVVVQEQAGTNGYQASAYKTVRDRQGVETRTTLSRDTYAPANRILRVGVKAEAATETEAEVEAEAEAEEPERELEAWDER